MKWVETFQPWSYRGLEVSYKMVKKNLKKKKYYNISFVIKNILSSYACF